ncbi:hypothetical protein BT96DRAFT_946302 [Gymnopus androsaceus JB14]|uniref:Uncharacterized protein n=1 Tax=Gymnopus androsaceus JB14 TaxID=1447944 RepID=A0A6A4GWH3_9AGAR|nr:hypothetical protein BT96DRAFT_946302 [Gymnopus androsaceus JB14]
MSYAFPVIRIPVIVCQGIFTTGCVVKIVLFAQMCFEPHLESFVIPYIAVFTTFVAGFHKEREGAFIVLVVLPVYTVLTFAMGCLVWGHLLGLVLHMMDCFNCALIGIAC